MKKDTILLVIGASAGGTTALPEVIEQLSADMNASVLGANPDRMVAIVDTRQHLPQCHRKR